MADEMDIIRGRSSPYHHEEDDDDDEEDAYVVDMDDEFKRQLCLGAVDTLANALAFQNWLNGTQTIETPSGQQRKLQRSWKLHEETNEFIISWRKKKRHTSYAACNDSDSDESSDSDDESERVNDDTTVTTLEYFTVATQSNLSNTVKLDEDVLTWLPPSAPTSTKDLARKNMDRLLQADDMFNALSLTLMIAGAFMSSSRSTTSNTATNTDTTTPSSSSHHKKRGRRWAQFSIPVNANQDGFQFILVDTASLEDLDCTLNSVVNATFATVERVYVEDMVTSVKTCLTRRGIPFDYKRKEQEEEPVLNHRQRRRMSTGCIPTKKKILKEEDLPQLILCKQGLVPGASNNNNNNNAAENDSTPGLLTQFEFDPQGRLRDIGLAFG